MAQYRVTAPDGGVYDVTAPDTATQDEIMARVTAMAKPSKISAPPSIRDYIVAGLRDVSAETLPILGLLGGGTLGAVTGGPVGGVGGAALGYAGGRQANRTIGSIAATLQGVPESTPSIPGLALTIGKDILTGAALEAGPSAVLSGARAIVSEPVKRALGITAPTAEDLSVVDAARRLGIPLSGAVQSGSTGAVGAEAVPTIFPIGRQIPERMAERTRTGAQRAAETLQQTVGPAKSLEQAGQAIQRDVTSIARAQENAPTELVDQTLTSFGTSRMGNLAFGGTLKAGGKEAERARRTEASRLYEEAFAAGGRTTDVSMTTTNQMATQMLDAERRLGGTSPAQIAARAAGLKAATAPPTVRIGGQAVNPQDLPIVFLQQHGLDTGTRTLEEAVSIQQRLHSLIRNTTDDYTRRQLRQLFNAVSQDISNFAASAPGDVGAKLAQASTFYREEVAGFFARRSPLRKLFDKEPAAIAEDVLTTRSADRIQALMRVLPTTQKDEFRRQVLEQMKSRSLDVRTGEVNPQRFVGELDAFGDENLRLLMGDKVQGVNRLRTTLQTNFGAGTANRDLAKVVTANPEQIVNSFARGRIKSVDDFDALWQVISPTTQAEARGALYNEVLLNSFDPTSGRFSIDRFLRQKSLVPDAIWNRMLGPNAGASLADLQRVLQRVSTFSRIAANPSQTSGAILGRGQLLAAAGLGMSTMLGREDPESFSLKLFGILSPLALGMLVFSKGGQRFLAGQPRIPVVPQGATATAVKLGVAQSIQSPDLQELLR